jgi:N-acetylglucosaminyldiphosphoundecaprenol N-acetyl-beta-D-mannosaminyltransferase
MGMPRQELWIERARGALPGCSFLAVGALFRWYTGIERRGPRWLTDHGFEWLCRLFVQPRKVARRYLLGLPRFAARVAWLKLRGARATLEKREL